MLRTRMSKIHRTAIAARVGADSSTRRTSADAAAAKSPPAGISQAGSPGETAAVCSKDSDLDSLFEEESDEEDAGIVSSPAPSPPDSGKKRKASDDAASSTDKASPAKKAKLTSLSPPVSPVSAQDASKKRKTSDDAASDADEAVPAKKVTLEIASPSPPASPPPIDIGELFFPSTTVRSLPAAPAPIVAAPPRRPIRCKKPVSNPIRTDVRMGVRGTVAPGAGTVHHAPPSRPTPSHPPKPTPPTPTNAPPPTDPPTDPALQRLLAAQAHASAHRRELNLVDRFHITAHTRAALKKADSNRKPSLAPPRPVPLWRQDNPDLAEADAELRGTARPQGVVKKRSSATSGLAAGAQRLVKIGTKGRANALNMSSTTFEYKRKVRCDEEMEEKRAAWMKEKVEELREKKAREARRAVEVVGMAREIKAERERVGRALREKKEERAVRRRRRIGDGLDLLFLEEGL